MAELKRTLGFWTVCAFTFLNLMNTGIFFGPHIGAQVAGASSMIAWMLLALMSTYIGMCFAELTTMFPSAGGVYEFAKQAYGRFVSFEVGWTTWVINNIATALMVSAAVEYLLPEGALTIFGFTFSAMVAKLALSILVILTLNYIAYRGADQSARLMLGLSIFAFILLVLVLVPGAMQLHLEHFSGFSIHWGLIFTAAFLLSETFYGWEAISFMAEEIKDPERTIPRALIATTTFVAIAAVGVAIVTMGVLGVTTLSGPEAARPIILLLEQMHLVPWLVLVANLGIVITFLGNAAGNVIGSPRLLMALSRDKLFIEQFSDIHPKRQTPYKAILLQTIVALLIVTLASGAYNRLLAMVVAPSVIIYMSMIVLVPYFRAKRPEHPRLYRAPLGKFLPYIILLFYFGIISTWALTDPDAVGQLRLLGSFMLFSIPIYLLLTYFYDPDALIGTMNAFSFLNLWLENVIIPKRLRKEVLEFLPEAQGRHVLEFGSGVGTLTLHLATHVGAKGRVSALELSGANVRITERRMKRAHHLHVTVIHDPHLINRVHPDVKSADMIVSIGNLSYIQDVRKVLREMNALLPRRGHVCFVEYIDFFWFLPNPKWLSNPDVVRQVFADAGFAVTVRVRRGLFWKYLYIYGIKDGSGSPYI